MQLFIMLRTCLILLTIVSYTPIKSAEAPIPSGYLSLGNPDSRRAPILLDLTRTPSNQGYKRNWHQIIREMRDRDTLVIKVATKKPSYGFGLSFFYGDVPLDKNHESIVMTKTLTKSEIQELILHQTSAQTFYPRVQGYAPAYDPAEYIPHGVNPYAAPHPHLNYAQPLTQVSLLGSYHGCHNPYSTPVYYTYYPHQTPYPAAAYPYSRVPTQALPVSASPVTTVPVDPTLETIKLIQSKIRSASTKPEELSTLQTALTALMAIVSPSLPAPAVANPPTIIAPSHNFAPTPCASPPLVQSQTNDGTSQRNQATQKLAALITTLQKQEDIRRRQQEEEDKRKREEEETATKLAAEQKESEAAARKAEEEAKAAQLNQQQEQQARTQQRKKEEEAAQEKARKEREAKEAATAERLQQEQEKKAAAKLAVEQKEREASQKEKEEKERKQKEKEAAQEKARKEREAKEAARLAALEEQVNKAAERKAQKDEQLKRSQNHPSLTQVKSPDSEPQSDEPSPIAPKGKPFRTSRAEELKIRKIKQTAEKQAALDTAITAEISRFEEIEKAYRSQNYQLAAELLGKCNRNSQRFADTVILLTGTIKTTKTEGVFIPLCDLVLPLVLDKEKRLSHEQKIELLLFLADHNLSKMRLLHLEQAKNLGSKEAALLFHAQCIEDDYMNPSRPQCKEDVSCIHQKAAAVLTQLLGSSLRESEEAYRLSIRSLQVKCPNVTLSQSDVIPIDAIYERAKESLSPAQYERLLKQTTLPNSNNLLSKSPSSAFVPGLKTGTDSRGVPVAVACAAVTPELSTAFLAKIEAFFQTVSATYEQLHSAEAVKGMIDAFLRKEIPNKDEIFFIYNTKLKNSPLLAIFYEVLLRTQGESHLKLLSDEELKTLSSSVAENLSVLIEEARLRKNPGHQKAIPFLSQIYGLAIKISHEKAGEYTIIKKNPFSPLLRTFFETYKTVTVNSTPISLNPVAQRFAKKRHDEHKKELRQGLFALLAKIETQEHMHDFVIALKEFEDDEYYSEFREQTDEYLQTLSAENLAIWHPYTNLPSTRLIKLLSTPQKRGLFPIIFGQFQTLLKEYLSKVPLTRETFVHLEDLFSKLFLYTSSRAEIEQVLETFKKEKFTCCIIKTMYLHMKPALDQRSDEKTRHSLTQQLETCLTKAQAKTDVHLYIRETLTFLKSQLMETDTMPTAPSQGAASADTTYSIPAEAVACRTKFSFEEIFKDFDKSFEFYNTQPMEKQLDAVVNLFQRATSFSDLELVIERTKTDPLKASIYFNAFLIYLSERSHIPYTTAQYLTLIRSFEPCIEEHYTAALKKSDSEASIAPLFSLLKTIRDTLKHTAKTEDLSESAGSDSFESTF